MAVTLKDALAQLESRGNVRARNIRNGAGDYQFEVQHGDSCAAKAVRE